MLDGFEKRERPARARPRVERHAREVDAAGARRRHDLWPLLLVRAKLGAEAADGAGVVHRDAQQHAHVRGALADLAHLVRGVDGRERHAELGGGREHGGIFLRVGVDDVRRGSTQGKALLDFRQARAVKPCARLLQQ